MLVAEANQKFESKSQPAQDMAKRIYEMLVAEANQKFESKSQPGGACAMDGSGCW